MRRAILLSLLVVASVIVIDDANAATHYTKCSNCTSTQMTQAALFATPPDASQLHTVYVMDDVQETINAWSVAVIIPFPGTVLKFPIGTSVPPAVEANYQSSLLAIETANATMSEGPNNGPNFDGWLDSYNAGVRTVFALLADDGTLDSVMSFIINEQIGADMTNDEVVNMIIALIVDNNLSRAC